MNEIDNEGIYIEKVQNSINVDRLGNRRMIKR